LTEKLNPLGLGCSFAIISAICMLALGILGNLGIYMGAVENMQQWHMFFSLSIAGIIAGIIESAIISFVLGYLFGLIYNRFV